jgi:hypothetical protein
MKKFLLLLPLLAIGGAAVAQKSTIVKYEPSEIGEYAVNEIEVQNPIRHPRFETGDILFSETFDFSLWEWANNNGVAVPSNMPNGWTAVDNTGNNFYWRWSITGPRGRYTSGSGASAFIPNNSQKVYSTSDNSSGERGFMLFEADFYNTNAEGQLVQSPVVMDSYIQTRAIDAEEYNAVHLYLEQWHRFCCASYGLGVGPKVYVSNNGTNWTEYAVHKSPINEVPLVNPSRIEMSISSVAANQATVYLRFHLKGMTHYHWSIDDIMIFEPIENDMRIIQFWADYAHEKLTNTTLSDEKNFSPIPFAVPFHALQNIVGFRALVSNFGSVDATNVLFSTEIRRNEYGEMLYENVSNPITSMSNGQEHVFEMPCNYPFPPTEQSIGRYMYAGIVSMDTEDENPDNNERHDYVNITRNIIAFSNPNYAHYGRARVRNPNTASDNDGVGAIYMLNPVSEESNGLFLHGARVFISNDINNWYIWRSGDLAYIRADVYEGVLVNNSYEFVLSEPIATSVEYFPVDSTCAGQWTYLSFGENSVPIFPQYNGHQYLLVFRAFTNNLLFYLGADRTSNAGLYSHVSVIGNEVYNNTPNSKLAAELVVGISETLPLATLTFQFQNQEGNSLFGRVEITVPNEDGIPVFMDIPSNSQGQVIIPGLKPGFYKYTGVFRYYRQTGMVLVDGQDTTVYFSFYSINELTALNEAQIYPNPTTNTFRISCPTPVSKIVLSTIEGKTVHSTDYPTEYQEFSLNDFATGIYFVTIFDQKGNNITRKVVKL